MEVQLLLNAELDAIRNQNVPDIRTVVLLIWKSRNDPSVAEFLTQLMSNYVSNRSTYKGIEFYLPQLAHLMVHIDWASSNTLEYFTLLIAQQSLHSALLLHWILSGFLKDYQKENEAEKVNVNADSTLYIRCSDLLSKLERSVVFGNPSNSTFAKMLQEATITKEELIELENSDRKFQAMRFCEDDATLPETIEFSGILSFHRCNERGVPHLKNTWKERKFVIINRVLCCLRISDNVIKRSIPLADCTVRAGSVSEITQGLFYLELTQNETGHKFKMAAPSEAIRHEWLVYLKKAIASPPRLVKSQAIDINTLTPSQIARFGFFKSTRDFISRLTDISESLRFVDRDKRKVALEKALSTLVVPGCVYIPLCSSTESWKRVVRAVPSKSFPFSTKEQCPCLMTFETTADESEQTDVATYLYTTLGFDTILYQQQAAETVPTNRRAEFQQEFIRAARNSVTELDVDIEQLEEAVGPSNLWMDSHPNNRISHDLIMKEQEAIKRFKLNRVISEVVDYVPPSNKGKFLSSLGKYIEVESDSMSNKLDIRDRTESGSLLTFGRLIAKSNDDLRQEVFIMQVITYFHDIWAVAKLNLPLKPYQILSTSQTCGLIEVLENSNSIDGMKKENGKCSILEFFQKRFGSTEKLHLAQRNFTESMAAYSVTNYILGIKDRHNGNIMLELDTGRVVHIDFGFVLGMAPGKDKFGNTNFSFERAPFKLTKELADAMGTHNWDYFVELLGKGLLEIRKHYDTVITLIEIMGYKSKLPCFNQPGGGVQRVLREFKQKLFLDADDSAIPNIVKRLAKTSLNSRGTQFYEWFQLKTNGIEPVH